MAGFVACLLTALALTTSSASGATFNRLPEEARAPDGLRVDQDATGNSFTLASPSFVAPVYVSEQESDVVHRACGFFADDVARITSRTPEVVSRLPKGDEALVVGTLGGGGLVDDLIASGRLAAPRIQGCWESFEIRLVENPMPGLRRALVVVGSDRRGTAYGILSLSQCAGVSPWYWWADAVPEKKEQLHVHLSGVVRDGPAVRYRGIFLNDERFGGLALWAAKHLDPDTANMGPGTYTRIFELMLRLRANYLWPAMHRGTRAFNSYPENARLADSFGIVMGSSHCEIMLRDNEYEWALPGTYGDFNYKTNRSTMLKYWDERLQTNGKYENLYTLGLRGVHDTPMEGAVNLSERTRLTQLALEDQRTLLKQKFGDTLPSVGQVFCAYKEVLAIYLNGLVVPDDVTLLWADDNHGFLRNLPDDDERRRSGGSGLYYHLSYHGDPESWLWLSSLSPALLAEELGKAYALETDRVWMFNVGDIKPAEKELSFALAMAWNPRRWNLRTSHEFLLDWFGSTLGKEVAAEAATLQEEFYRLAAWGKPEHVWLIDYSAKEREARLADYRRLVSGVEALDSKVRPERRDAFFELLEYPCRGAALANELHLQARASLVAAAAGREAEALSLAGARERCCAQLEVLTKRYTQEVASGKWEGIMKWKPWQRPDSLNYERTPVADEALLARLRTQPPAEVFDVGWDGAGAVFRWKSSKPATVPVWFLTVTPGTDNKYEPADNTWWKLRFNEEVLDGVIRPVGNNWHPREVGPQWSRMGDIKLHEGDNEIELMVSKPGAHVSRVVVGEVPPEPPSALLSLPLSSSRLLPGAGGTLTSVSGLGGSGEALLVEPVTAPAIGFGEFEKAPKAVFDFQLPEAAKFLEVRLLPTLRLNRHRSSRVALRLNGGVPVEFTLQTEEFSSAWQKAVLNGYLSRRLSCAGLEGHPARLEVFFLDPTTIVEGVSVY